MSIKSLKVVVGLALGLQVILAPVDYFLVQDRYIFPFYSWELGFGKAYAKAPQALIYIESIDGVLLPEKTTIGSLPQYFNWRKRQDNKLVSSLLRYLKTEKIRAFEKKKELFENKFFIEKGYNSIRYKVVERVTNLKNGKTQESVYGPFEYRAK